MCIPSIFDTVYNKLSNSVLLHTLYTFEIITHKRISSSFSIKNVIFESQNRFRRNHQPTAIYDFFSKIYNAIDAGKSSLSMFVDLSKTLDTVAKEARNNKTAERVSVL